MVRSSTLAALAALIAFASVTLTAQAEVDAYVAGFMQTDGRANTDATYHLLLSPESGAITHLITQRIETAINVALREQGFEGTSQMLDAETIVVVRLGLLDRYPGPDAVLAGANPDQPLPDGRAYVRVEGYATREMTDFATSAGRSAARDSLLDFIVWETAVEANVLRDNLNSVLPALGRIAANHVLTNTRPTLVKTK